MVLPFQCMDRKVAPTSERRVRGNTMQSFPQRFSGRQSSLGGSNKATLYKWGIFGRKWDTAGIILGEDPAAHCFPLKDLVPTSFSK